MHKLGTLTTSRAVADEGERDISDVFGTSSVNVAFSLRNTRVTAAVRTLLRSRQTTAWCIVNTVRRRQDVEADMWP